MVCFSRTFCNTAHSKIRSGYNLLPGKTRKTVLPTYCNLGIIVLYVYILWQYKFNGTCDFMYYKANDLVKPRSHQRLKNGDTPRENVNTQLCLSRPLQNRKYHLFVVKDDYRSGSAIETTKTEALCKTMRGAIKIPPASKVIHSRR